MMRDLAFVLRRVMEPCANGSETDWACDSTSVSGVSFSLLRYGMASGGIRKEAIISSRGDKWGKNASGDCVVNSVSMLLI